MYNIGVDIGTNSIGIAVVDDNYNLVKKKGKNLWTTRIVEQAKTAEKTRIYRSTRRRYKRRRERILKLQNLFLEEVKKLDINFFNKLNESCLHSEDRIYNKEKYTLFNDESYTDKEFYNEYKTLYHLRKMLIDSVEKVDIRFIYLALHNIIKYRGHFLNEGQNLSTGGSPEVKLKELNEILALYELQELQVNVDKFKELIKDKTKNKKMKIDDLIVDIEDKDSKKFTKSILSGIFGLTFTIKDIFSDVDNLGEIGKEKIKFSDANYEEKEEDYENLLDDKMEVIRAIQSVYSAVTLNDILRGEEYISKAMVKSFEIYKYQLNLLKNLLKKYDSKSFKDIFKNNKNQKGYFFFNKNKGKYIEDFYKNLSGILTKLENVVDDKNDLESIAYIKGEIDNENLLIKQNTTLNVLIPYQLNLKELKIIIENQKKYYPFLDEEKEKIEKILTFKIPYYVGPLSKKNNKNAWAIRRDGMENIKIEPWNFEDVIDTDKSAELFIKKMLGKCTYFQNEYVIPKNSLLASDYVFYNEINKIKISSTKSEKDVYLDKYDVESLRKVFLKKTKVKESDIIEWAAQNLNIGTIKDIKIEGLQGNKEATSSLKPYIDFERILNNKFEKKDYKMVEEIISWLTIFEDKKIVSRKIRANYANLSEKQIDSILKLKYKGWLRLSEKLLNGVKTKLVDGREFTVIDILREGNPNGVRYGDARENLMQILNNDRYDFKKILKKEALSKEITEKSYSALIEDLQVSPALKRVTWQAIKLIDEIIQITGEIPTNIFVEVARSDEKSERTKSKINLLKQIYEDQKIGKGLVDELKGFKLLSEKQELYFRQEGKCMYTMEALNIDTLYEYDVDHIIPKSYIKDDSIDNKVLVKRQKNQDRSDNITPMKYIDNKSNKYKILAFWERLKENNLISEKKLRNLKSYSISEEQEFGFIARQLVETRQIIKNISNLLQTIYKKDEVKVINVKADVIDDFRKQFKIVKNRNINNFHHAKDAYMTAVVGLYANKKFPDFEEYYMKEFIKKEFKKYKEDKDSLKYKYGFIVGSMNKSSCDDQGKIIWDKDIISKIKKQLTYRDIMVTRQLVKVKGELFQATIKKKLDINQNAKTIEIKKGYDVHKYGYYTNENVGYFSLIQYLDKNKLKKALVGIPIRFDKKIGNSDEELMLYLKEQGYLDVKILKKKILKNQLISIDKGDFYLASPTEWHNAKELILKEEYLQRLVEFKKKSKIEDKELSHYEAVITGIIDRLKDEKTEKKYIDLLINLQKEFSLYRFEGKIEVLNQFLKKDIVEKLFLREEITNLKNKLVDDKSKYIDESSLLMEIVQEWRDKVNKLYPILSNIKDKIDKKMNIIATLKISNILIVINELFKITANDAQNGNLKIIGLTDREGRIQVRGKEVKNITIINKSITGFYVNKEVF